MDALTSLLKDDTPQSEFSDKSFGSSRSTDTILRSLRFGAGKEVSLGIPPKSPRFLSPKGYTLHGEELAKRIHAIRAPLPQVSPPLCTKIIDWN